MTDKTTARGIKEWLEEEFGAEGGWRSSQVAQELSEDVVRTIRRDFRGYDRQAKLGVLFSIFQLRRSERQFMQKDLIGITEAAVNDQDEWVRLVGNVMKLYPLTGTLNLAIEDWSPSFKALYHDLGNKIRTKGIKFHSLEHAIMTIGPGIQPDGLEHFQTNEKAAPPLSDNERRKLFAILMQKESNRDNIYADALVVSQPMRQSISSAMLASSSSKEGPVSPTSLQPPKPFPSQQPTRSTTMPLHPAPGASNLFIPQHARKESLAGNKPSSLRTPARPVGATRPAGALPAGLVRQSRVQMIGFEESSNFQRDINRNIEESRQRLQEQREQAAEKRRQEQAERKRQELEEKRQEQERRRQENRDELLRRRHKLGEKRRQQRELLEEQRRAKREEEEKRRREKKLEDQRRALEEKRLEEERQAQEEKRLEEQRRAQEEKEMEEKRQAEEEEEQSTMDVDDEEEIDELESSNDDDDDDDDDIPLRYRRAKQLTSNESDKKTSTESEQKPKSKRKPTVLRKGIRVPVSSTRKRAR